MSETGFVDLFCGAGLFSAGFIEAGFDPALAIDIDRFAIDSYRRNIGDAGEMGSVLEPRRPRQATVLLAGPPCQGFSTLGRRNPADERNRLCMAVPRWAELCRALVVVVENVPPFVRSTHWSAMADSLRTLGFETVVWQLDAARYGTPQRRVRSFTIASKIGPITAPEPEKCEIAAKIAFRQVSDGDPMHIWPSPSFKARDRFRLTPPLGDKRDVLRAAPRSCPPSWHRLGTAEATDVWGRIDPEKPANTLRCRFQNPSTGRYVHPSEDRVISIREGARLQGVRDGWVFTGHREAMVRQVGNGVPVPVARAVATSVASALAAAGADVRSAA